DRFAEARPSHTRGPPLEFPRVAGPGVRLVRDALTRSGRPSHRGPTIALACLVPLTRYIIRFGWAGIEWRETTPRAVLQHAAGVGFVPACRVRSRADR